MAMLSEKAREAHLCKAIFMSLNELYAIGTSKKEAREQFNAEIQATARAAGKSEDEIRSMPFEASPYIHSYNTFSQYLCVCQKYAVWLAENHPDVQKLKYAHRMGYDHEYIQQMIDRGLSASSIASATAALAKLYRCHADDIHNHRPERCYKDFTRSRGYSEQQYHHDIQEYGDIPVLCRCIGVREVELEHLYPECFYFDMESGDLWLHLDGKKQHTKGGKTRDVRILPENQQTVLSILAKYPAGQLICPKAPSHLDIHAIRSMYAMDFYNRIARPIEQIPLDERVKLKHPKIDNSRPGQVRTTSPAVYTRKSDGKQFDRSALLTVSRSLGHNREDVVVHSYLR